MAKCRVRTSTSFHILTKRGDRTFAANGYKNRFNQRNSRLGGQFLSILRGVFFYFWVFAKTFLFQYGYVFKNHTVTLFDIF